MARALAIRPVGPGDIPALGRVAEAAGLFPAAMLPDLLAGALSGGEGDLALAALRDDAPVGLCLARAEEMTEGTWNMLALGVSPTEQGTGCGTALVARLEEVLRDRGQRLLIVDTSGAPAFEGARRFYTSRRYVQEARIRDFWAEGDDKITFAKRLRAAA